MGQGERQMRNWGWAGGGLGILAGVLAIISSSLVLAMHYDDIKLSLSAVFAYVAIAVVVLAGIVIILCVFGIIRIQGADDVYSESTYEKNHVQPQAASLAAPESNSLFPDV